ncbi:MAG: ATP-binding cassette domain-containing protein [Alphaproteobacteria bacterium]|nr:ATP-binding cassette domain-containing protein [Alphaproteobacteria bacterium]
MIAETAFMQKMDTKARPKVGASQILLQMLRSGGWINQHNEEGDLAPLLPVMADALGINREIHELCAALPWHDEDAEKDKTLNITGLLNALSELGFVAHAVKMHLDDLDARLCPCLFVHGEDEDVFVVLGFNQKKDAFEIFNAKTQMHEDFLRAEAPFGKAWIFVKEKEVQNALSENVREASGHSWFRALMERFAGGLWQVITIGAMLTFLSLAAPLFVMLVYDRVIGAHAPEALTPLLIGALLALGTEAALRLVRAHVLSWYGARLDFIVGSQIFERLMRMPVLFTERASVAAQIARIKAFDAVRAFFTGRAFLALAELPFTLILIAAIVMIAGPVAFVPVIAAGFYALLVFVMRPAVRTAMRLSSKANSTKQEMIIQTFEKMDGLRAGGLTAIWFKDFRDLSGKASLAGFRAGYLASILEALSQGIYILSGLAVVVWGVMHIWTGGMSAGSLIAVMILTWRVLGPMQILTNALPRYEQLNNAVAQINRLMTIETESSDAKVTARLDSPKGDLDFKKVGLRYTKDNDPVFTGLSFVAKLGEMIAVTGGNGTGKSTVLKLINGLYHPQAGAIHIDGIDIRQLEPQHLRRHIAYVPQSPSVFHGTIADNLRFANPLATDELLRDVLEQVDLWSYVETLPPGMHTTIGMHGAAQLPTGLSYNLNLARAYIKDTPVMLIDEMPYAFLNSPSGAHFRKTLESWKGRKTVVLVTHREDYLVLADKAVLLHSGQAALVDTPEKIIQSIYDSQEIAHA